MKMRDTFGVEAGAVAISDLIDSSAPSMRCTISTKHKNESIGHMLREEKNNILIANQKLVSAQNRIKHTERKVIRNFSETIISLCTILFEWKWMNDPHRSLEPFVRTLIVNFTLKML